MSSPEFDSGDEVILVCPAGAPPYPEGPATVVGCVYFDELTQIAVYVVEHGDGRRESVDGVEMIRLDHWADWMKKNAN